MRKAAIIIGLVVLTVACGYDSQEIEYRKKPRAGGAGGSAWDGIASIVEKSCNSCHGKSVGASFTASNFGSKAQTRVGNGSMPPGGNLAPEDKAALLAYKP